MIFIDDREGSREMVDLVEEGLLVRLEYGDACFSGNGPEGEVEIGVERKRIGDLINSVDTGRLSGHQIPGMLEKYYRVYLIVEGRWRGNSVTGELEVQGNRGWHALHRGKRKYTYTGVWNYLNTLEVMTGVMIRTSDNMVGTANIINGLAGWWRKEWDRHRAHVAMNRMIPPSPYLKPGKPSLLRRMAAELPGIGWERAVAVEKKFKSIECMVYADEWEWRHVEGIGKITAKRVWEALHE